MPVILHTEQTNVFGFDYLRDNMKPAMRGDRRFDPVYQQAQGPLHYAIIDEVDKHFD